ncbi:MAG: DUF1365 family protein [Methylobacteriaceae bacterium]|nr:DUF1365 family protein [Methylobacteriaceae bacterium]
MTFRSALYVGFVNHRRFRPRAHHLNHRMFWLLLDLDEIEVLHRGLRLFSHNRFNAVSFYDGDHLDGDFPALRDRVERLLREAGIKSSRGVIKLLCMPRIFGYGFNPLSIYFCHSEHGPLDAIIHEVHNTFGERHSYVTRVKDAEGAVLRHHAKKRFYVSPFLDMGIEYAFRVSAPAKRVTVSIQGRDADGPIIAAALSGLRRPLTDRALAALLISMPLLTLKVIAAIHWHALQLWWKGIKLRPRPDAPVSAVTLLQSGDLQESKEAHGL